MPDATATAAAMGLPEAVSRLAAVGEDAFLAPHHLEVARRLSHIFERARLRQRVTMSYDPARLPGHTNKTQADLADRAADSRHSLAVLAGRLPADCWGVLVDVCVYDKGLQQIEQERGWPRRSAKLVLRIALEQLAAVMKLDREARGPEGGRTRTWLPERPPMFADSSS